MDIYLAKQLIKAVRASSKLDYNAQTYFVNYINGIKNGTRTNDFVDDELLQGIILGYANGDIKYDGNEFETKFEEMKDNIKFLLPEGANTPGFESIKRSLLGGKNYETEKSLYAILDNKIDYEQIMNIISSKKEISDNKQAVFNYAVEVAPYCINQGVLKREIVSFINGLESEIGDITGYSLRRLAEAKKRVGVYPLDESELAKIAEDVRRMESYLRRAENYENSLKEREDASKKITSSSLKEIQDAKESAIKDLKSVIETEIIRITNRLEEYLETLKANMKTSTDEAINLILKDAQEKIKNLRVYAQDINNDTIKNLIQARNEAESSLQVIRDYIQNEPELRRIIADTAKSVAVKDAYLNGTAPTQTSETPSRVIEVPGMELPSGPTIIIPGFDRQILPADQEVVIPEGKINTKLVEAFDPSIPLTKRLDKIMAIKEKREKNGELFHSVIEEVLVNVISGKWVYIYGPSGCGKTYIFRQVADLLGINYADSGTLDRKEDVLAYTDVNGRFRATQTFISLLYGGLLSYDEFDSNESEPQIAIREIYDVVRDVAKKPNVKRYVKFAETLKVPVNPNFRIIAAGNTKGNGPDEVHNASKKIDDRIQQRFTFVPFNFDPVIEKQIFGKYGDWYRFFKLFRSTCEQYAKSQLLSSTPGTITTRDAQDIVDALKDNYMSVDWLIKEKCVQNKDADYLNFIAQTIRHGGEEKNIRYDLTEPITEKGAGNANYPTLVKSLIYRCEHPEN